MSLDFIFSHIRLDPCRESSILQLKELRPREEYSLSMQEFLMKTDTTKTIIESLPIKMSTSGGYVGKGASAANGLEAQVAISLKTPGEHVWEILLKDQKGEEELGFTLRFETVR